jgi:hypothetical protein
MAGVRITGLAMYIACSSHPKQALRQPNTAWIGAKKVTLLDAAPFPHLTQFHVIFFPFTAALFIFLYPRSISNACLFFLLVLYIADNHTLGQQMVVIQTL